MLKKLMRRLIYIDASAVFFDVVLGSFGDNVVVTIEANPHAKKSSAESEKPKLMIEQVNFLFQ